jgi:hypothetical protein
MKRILTVFGALAVALTVGLWISLGSSAAAPSPTSPSPAVTSVQPSDPSAQPSGPAGPQQPGATDDEKPGEQETPGESAKEGDTHEDPAGQDVNHQCPPDCDTANGEKP